MSAAPAADFAALIAPVARRLWGEPNKALSKPAALRWGNQGARIVYPDTGAFKDTEADCSGGTLDLIQHARGVDKGGAVAWLVSEGLLSDQAKQHAVRLSPDQRIVATFVFTDAKGGVAFRKHRVEPGRGGRRKEFAFDRPDGAGGWQWGRGDAQVPYRLPHLASAPKGETIYMAEGEAKADKLASWGLIATSSKDWRAFDFSGYVKGRIVVILPDNDETGERLAEKVAADVERAEGRPVIVRLPGLPEKGDVLDWSGGAEDLAGLVESALAGEKPTTFPIADLAAWGATVPEPKRFLMEGFIPAGEVTMFTGAGGTNKSTFCLQLCLASAARLPMLGLSVQPGNALYVTAEDEDRENHFRAAKIASQLRVSLASLAGRLNIVSLRGRLNNELATFDNEGRLKAAAAFSTLRATIKATASKLVVLDNVAHLFAGNENDRSQVTAFINLLYALCRELEVTVILIGHPNKDFLKGNMQGNATSGSTAWLNAVRSHMLISRPADNLDPDARLLTLGKANYSRPDQQLSFLWCDFALVREEDLPADNRAERAAIMAANAENAAFLACLVERNKQRRHVSEKPTASNYAPKQFVGMPEAKGFGRGKLEAAMDRLFRIGAIERGFIYRDTAEGKDIHGLREAHRQVPESSPEGSRKVLPEGSGNPQVTTGNTPPYIYDNTGAALEGAAPSPDGDGESTRGPHGETLAPGEQAAPGWLR
jgi:RecA-family ATPase